MITGQGEAQPGSQMRMRLASEHQHLGEALIYGLWPSKTSDSHSNNAVGGNVPVGLSYSATTLAE